MKDVLLIFSMLLMGLISWYRTGWRIFSIDNMLVPDPTLGFLSLIALFMFLLCFLLPPFNWVRKELLPKRMTILTGILSASVFVTGVIADSGWVFAHAIHYGDDHWYCQGFKHAYLHPNEGVVVRRGIDDPKDPQQFIVVRYYDCGDKWYQMSEQESAYPTKGTRVRVGGACLNPQIIASTSSKQFQEIQF